MVAFAKRHRFMASAFISAIALVAFGKIHLRVQSVVTGYEIGRLKAAEAQLLEKRSLLRMQVAQLTGRRHLELVSDSQDVIAFSGRLAVK